MFKEMFIEQMRMLQKRKENHEDERIDIEIDDSGNNCVEVWDYISIENYEYIYTCTTFDADGNIIDIYQSRNL